MNEFKDGDLVYHPRSSNKVLEVYIRKNIPQYPVALKCGDGEYTFTKDGKQYSNDYLPTLFPATDENKAALEVLYDVKLEEPPKDLESNAAYQKVCDGSVEFFALCSVSSESQGRANTTLVPRLIISANKVVMNGNTPKYEFQDTEGVYWRYAKFLSYVEIK